MSIVTADIAVIMQAKAKEYSAGVLESILYRA
jgi:hypothetical protein